MKRFLFISVICILVCSCSNSQPASIPVEVDANCFTLSDDITEVTVSEDGNLQVLRNKKTGHNYAGGSGLWRLYYNTHEEKEMQIVPDENVPEVTQDGDVIIIAYKQLQF